LDHCNNNEEDDDDDDDVVVVAEFLLPPNISYVMLLGGRVIAKVSLVWNDLFPPHQDEYWHLLMMVGRRVSNMEPMTMMFE
jgi:hypothetical protein